MRNTGSLIFGLLLILIGTIFLLDNLGYVNSDYVFENFWPLILVFIGINLLLRSRIRRTMEEQTSQESSAQFEKTTPTQSSPDFLVRSAIFGDINAEVKSKNFSGGSCSIIFGEIDIDLKDAELSQGQSVLKLNGVFGSINVIVPSSMDIKVQANLVAGQVSIKEMQKGGLFENVTYETTRYVEADRKLFIVASHVFGELRIRQAS